MNKLSIIVLSSDGYSDCWIPFFSLLKKNFPSVEKHELILSTNLLEFDFPGLDIINLANGIDVSWSKRLRLSLESASNEIVLVLVEDFFLKSKIESDVFSKFFHYMNEEKDIDHIRLRSARETKTIESRFDFLDEIDLYSKKRFTYQPGLWRKEVLLKYINDKEDPFMAEVMADNRSKKYRDGFFSISSSYVEKHGYLYDSYYSGVIYKGKWSHFAIDFLREQSFDLDYSIRGVISRLEKQKLRRTTRFRLINKPLFILKHSLYQLVLLYCKYRNQIVGIKSSN